MHFTEVGKAAIVAGGPIIMGVYFDSDRGTHVSITVRCTSGGNMKCLDTSDNCWYSFDIDDVAPATWFIIEDA